MELPESALALLHARTEGWAAGLRLAALSLAGHPDPAFRAAERLGGLLAAPHYLVPPARAWQLLALVRLGETERAEQALAELGEQDRDRREIGTAVAAPVLDGSAPVISRNLQVQSFLLEAIARDALGDPAAAGRAVERALDLAEPDGVLFPFLLQPAPGLLERHARHSARHAALISEILNRLPRDQRGPAGHGELASSRARAGPAGSALRLTEPLSRSEIRVLRYMPTNLPTPEIARELSLSVHTVRTHVRHLFAKLGAHGRTEAVARARALGLLAPSGRTT